LSAFTLNSNLQAESVTFGTSGNEFTIDFVNIGNAGNAADTTTYGAVPYEYRMGKYEISQNAITKATASGMTGVTAGPWTGDQPAANITWYEAAAFVNWLNTSTGKTAAYNLTFSNSSWSMALWSSEQAWTAGGTNLYRNKDTSYFLPSENEWYQAAYYNPAGSNYFLYPTASSSAPNTSALRLPARSTQRGSMRATSSWAMGKAAKMRATPVSDSPISRWYSGRAGTMALNMRVSTAIAAVASANTRVRAGWGASRLTRGTVPPGAACRTRGHAADHLSPWSHACIALHHPARSTAARPNRDRRLPRME
jgi:hypothetical protein